MGRDSQDNRLAEITATVAALIAVMAMAVALAGVDDVAQERDAAHAAAIAAIRDNAGPATRAYIHELRLQAACLKTELSRARSLERRGRECPDPASPLDRAASTPEGADRTATGAATTPGAGVRPGTEVRP